MTRRMRDTTDVGGGECVCDEKQPTKFVKNRLCLLCQLHRQHTSYHANTTGPLLATSRRFSDNDNDNNNSSEEDDRVNSSSFTPLSTQAKYFTLQFASNHTDSFVDRKRVK